MCKAWVADVVFDPRSGGAEATYTYRAEQATRGDAVLAPLGPRLLLGFVTRRYEADAASLGFPVSQLKSIEGVVGGLGLPEPLVALVEFLATETLTPLPSALSAATPPGVRDRLATAWRHVEAEFALQSAEAHPLSTAQRETLRALQDAGGTLVDSSTKRVSPAVKKHLRALKVRGLVEETTQLTPLSDRRKRDLVLRLTPHSERIEKFLREEGKKKPAQALTLLRLQATEHGGLSSQDIRTLAGVTETTIRALVDAELLERVGADEPSLVPAHDPNPEQQLAIAAVVDAIEAKRATGFLLFGVTGSGKTEVYLRAAAEALRQGRQVLYLVPEIALAAQAIARLRERFGRNVALLHSDLADGERLQNWMRIRSGEAAIVIGARSAVFAPLDNIGLIVVDEEHEATYKQEVSPRYHIKSAARFLSARHRCPVVFGSATPSVESFYEADQDRLTLLSLPRRAARAELPTVLVEDLSAGYRRGEPTIFLPPLTERVQEALDKGHQAILFLNRRAYAPFMICRDCGFQIMCPHCAVSLSFHRKDGRLRCHHCGHQAMPPLECSKCRGTRVNPFGIGTEKVEEFVRTTFPTATVGRLDRDVTKRKGALEETLAEFRSGDLSILVGTQMVAKGLDFPNVTVVGVVAADVSLNLPDFRASERTFQLLSQVAGRAGRGQSPGEVVIQTFNPEHPAVTTARDHNYLGFYEAVILEREQAGYPPFKRLVNVMFTGPARPAVVSAALDAADRLRTVGEVKGPTDCAIERVQNRWRRHLLLKLEPGASLAPLRDAMAGFRPKGIQVVVDVDPYNVM